ncbi:hypothetical protein MMC25_003003 [Agyrium rufum]|nr:hypothetical protein [Agyrium rufum]
MAIDYSKKKNAELEDILKARSLPHTGKKADLIARLQASDAENADIPSSKPANGAASTTTAADLSTAVADEIDWDDEPATTSAQQQQQQQPPPTSEPAAAALAAGGQGRTANPTAVPNQIPAIDPSSTNDLSTSDPTTTAETTTKAAEDPTAADGPHSTTAAAAEEPAPSFSAALPTSTLESELAKRKARAARFGLQENTEEATRSLERSKRFGTGSAGDKEGAEAVAAVKGLDEALPQRKKRGRDRDESKEGEKRAGSRRRVNGGGGGGAAAAANGRTNGGGGGGGGRGAPSAPAAKKERKAPAAGMSDKDMEAAEKRKARFASATAAEA